MTPTTSLKHRLAAGEAVFGPWCALPTGSAMNVTASAGFDFVIIDLEHGPASFEATEEMIRAAQSEGVSPLVRLGQIDEAKILRALDAGADGVLVAHAETPDDAAEAVALSKYHPIGRRGFSPYTRAGGYSGAAMGAHADRQNSRTLVGILLEGKHGIDNLDIILDTEHLDVVYIGAYDLSQALGIPGHVDDPRVRHELESCVRKIRDAGLTAGGFVARDRDDIQWMINIGMQFITYLPDCAVLHRAMRDAVDEFRKVTGR
jgi:4-hydroxy-2-oxoheptanedioate aldolase